MGCVKPKGSWCPESLLYQKKDGHAWPRPSVFWYDTDFSKKKKKKIKKFFFQNFQKKNLKSQCHKLVWQRLRTLGTFLCLNTIIVIVGYVRKDILANHIAKKHGPEHVPIEMRPNPKPKPVQVSRSTLQTLLPGASGLPRIQQPLQQAPTLDGVLVQTQQTQQVKWVALREKVPKCPESLSYQKKDRRAGPRPPFFWYDTDFLDFFWNFEFFSYFWKVDVITKEGGRARPSFGMTTTQDIRDLFA